MTSKLSKASPHLANVRNTQTQPLESQVRQRKIRDHLEVLKCFCLSENNFLFAYAKCIALQKLSRSSISWKFFICFFHINIVGPFTPVIALCRVSLMEWARICASERSCFSRDHDVENFSCFHHIFNALAGFFFQLLLIWVCLGVNEAVSSHSSLSPIILLFPPLLSQSSSTVKCYTSLRIIYYIELMRGGAECYGTSS